MAEVRFVQRRSRQELEPEPGDTLVTLTVDGGSTLESRVHLLGYAFIKVVQGTLLKQVLEYDLRRGVVKFIIANEVTPDVRGTFSTSLDEVPDVIARRETLA